MLLTVHETGPLFIPPIPLLARLYLLVCRLLLDVAEKCLRSGVTARSPCQSIEHRDRNRSAKRLDKGYLRQTKLFHLEDFFFVLFVHPVVLSHPQTAI